jgi:large subunit ribosomal protein L3
MPGHHGNKKVTVKNLEVVKVYKEKNLLLLRGSIPGANNRIVTIAK